MKNGIDPSQTLAQADASFKKALEIKPDHVLSRLNLGNANLVRAEFLLARGLSPVPDLERARASVKALSREDSYPGETAGLLAAAALMEAEWNLLSGMPSGRALGMARVQTEKALNSGLVDWEPLELLSRLEMLTVWQQVQEKPI